MCAPVFLCHCELKILEDQLIAHIGAKGQQRNGHLGNDSGLVVLDKGLIAANINDGTPHTVSSF